MAPLCCESVRSQSHFRGRLPPDWGHVIRKVFVKLRVDEWVHKDLWVAGRGKTSIQLAVSVRSVPRSNTACDIRVVLLYWLHRDLTVRSCSVLIYSVYVLYDVSINEAVSQKPNSRSEEEATGTRRAVVTEVEFMFLDISWCFCMQYRWAKMTFVSMQ
jgi:hypothetical protein